MTLQEIIDSNLVILTPAQIAPVLNCDPQWIRETARLNPQQLGFPVIRIGSRTKIPRVPFLRFLGISCKG